MQPRAVDWTQGVAWLGCGWRLFAAHWTTWVAMFVVYFLVVILAALVPAIGPLVLGLLSPALVAGVMHAAATQARGGAPEVAHLLRGLQDPARRGPLLTVGALLLGSQVVLGLLGVALFGAALLAGEGLLPEQAVEGSSELVAALELDPAAIGTGGLIALLVLLGIQVAVFAAFYFAPALVMLEEARPIESLKSSFMACLGNFLPLLLFGTVLAVLAVLAAIPLGLGLLVLFPVAMAAVYCSYDDIYH
jgi:uncharacterized membrane protein